MIAPGLIPKMSSSRVKTDRVDANHMARCYAAGMLTVVHIPSEEDEGDRDLTRTRTHLVKQVTSSKHYIQSLCKRLGWKYLEETKSKSYWTLKHRDWLVKKAETLSISRRVELEILIKSMNSTESYIKKIDEELARMADSPKYKNKVDTLRCFRGIETLSAMTLLTEIGDIKRFSHPSRLSSYAGLDIAEYSSGGKEKKLGITKMGNKYMRRVLIESAQYAPDPVRVSKPLKARRMHGSEEAIKIGDRCMERLHKKAVRLLFKGKEKNKVKVACARELLCFIWEALYKPIEAKVILN